tara:strand:+ start:254 stop:703 length:450 start_codon:yes stop_codon:yes gene_type:complete
MPSKQPKHDSSIDELTAWIEDNSKSSNKKKVKEIENTIKINSDKTKTFLKEEKKNKKNIIGNKFSRKKDPLYGKKGTERKLIIEDYKKQYEQAKMLKNNNDTNISPDMLNNFMNVIRDKGYDPEDIMQKLESDSYSEEYKNELVENIMK